MEGEKKKFKAKTAHPRSNICTNISKPTSEERFFFSAGFLKYRATQYMSCISSYCCHLDSRNTVLHFLLLHFTISMLQERVERRIKYYRDSGMAISSSGWSNTLVGIEICQQLFDGSSFNFGPDINHIHTAAIFTY